MRVSLALLVFVLTGACAAKTEPTASAAWSRATPPGAAVGVLYLDIAGANSADTLLRLESPVAREVELHSSTTEDGVMRMRAVASLNVPAASRVRLEPGGLHGMLVDLKQPLQEGERFPVTLVFERSGRVTVNVVVRSLGATSY